MANMLEDVFGSDLGSDVEPGPLKADVPEPVPESEKTKRKPISFSDSEDEEPQMDRRASKRPREDPAGDPSDDEEPRPKREDVFSSDNEDVREHEREREEERRQKQKKRRKREQKRKKPRSDDEYDEAGPSEPREEPVKQEVEEEPPKPEKPKTAFEKAVEENKALRRGRRKELNPAKVDEECVDFLERMIEAHNRDYYDHKGGKPALNKIRMLRDVELMCMKVSHLEPLLDNMMLAVFKSWLDPLSDGSLPNMQVRETLIRILLSIPVNGEWVERLENSNGLGRVIHFMTIREPYEPIKRSAQKLMQKWARPVYQSNSNYQDLLDEFDKPDEGRRAPKDGIASERRAARETISRMKTTQEKLEEFSSHTGKKREQILATVPKPGAFLYSVLAESEVQVDPKALRDRSGKAKMKKHDKTIMRLRKRNKSMNARAAKPSLNGRDD